MTNRFRRILNSLLIFIFLLSLYHTLVSGGIVLPSDGTNKSDSNIIKAQRYIYNHNLPRDIVLVGSSITARINSEDISPHAISLAMVAMSSQIGLEIVEREKIKPNILLIELSTTIQQGRNAKSKTEFINNLYNPFAYFLRLYIPMFRQEYQPIGIVAQFLIKAVSNEDKVLFRFLEEGKNTEKIIGQELIEKLIQQQIQSSNYPLSAAAKKVIKEESEYIKTQIKNFKSQGVRVILIDVPSEKRVQNTIMQKQLREMFKELFPPDTFEWMPEPPPRDWKTNDGIHLVTSSAKEYAVFLREQLLKTAP